MKIILIIVSCLIMSAGRAQSFDWWAASVEWDGVSHWSRYIITQPAYLGPNALPVPRIGNGSVDSNFSISATGNFHFSKGDKTQNLTLYANYCLVKDRISFDLMWVPYEHFSMSHEIKTRRHVFHHFYYDKRASGDIHLNTTIQLLNKWRENIHLAMRIGYRFPAATGLGMARYTDGPGYFVDFSFGKPLKNSPVKWIGMLGFYAWQMNLDRHRQNDAFLFGSGLEWNTKKLRIQTYAAGYLGYLNKSGDKPVVVRATAEKKFKRTSLLIGFQQGMLDFKYSSGELGMKYNFR